MKSSDINIFEGSFLSEDFNEVINRWRIEGFDIVVGNPPYQEMDGGSKASAKPLYNVFIEKSLKFTDKLIFITPSRWFGGGKGLDNFRKMMLNRTDIKLIKDFKNSKKIFESVNIGGGVSYFLIDKKHNGLCEFINDRNESKLYSLNKYDRIIRDFSYHDLIDKIISRNYIFIDSIIQARGYYNISTNDKNLKDYKDNNSIKCFVSSQKGNIKWINREKITKEIQHKVLTPRAFGNPKDGFGRFIYSDDKSVCSDTYLFFKVKNEEQANNLITYLKSNLVHFLVVMRKIDSAIKPDTCKWIPLLN
ncbi:MAG: Eco57I restriction-modification methylase domain-containing protein, partial [Candidatus Woesearchaeota archaeon]